MAKPSYRVYDTPEETLKIWAKNLNYDLTSLLDSAVTKYLTAAGTVDDLVITHKNFVLADGARSWFKAAGDNTGAVTVKVSDSEIKDLKDIDGNALSAGDITEDYYYEIVYDSTSDFFVLAPKGGAFTDNADNDIQSLFTSNVSIPEGYYNGDGEVLMPVVTAGENIISGNDISGNTLLTNYTEIAYRYVKLKGTYRVSFNLYTTHGGNIVYARIYINDVATGTERSTTTENPGTNFSQDFSGLEPGDKISIYAKSGSGDPVGSRILYGRLKINEVLIANTSA